MHPLRQLHQLCVCCLLAASQLLKQLQPLLRLRQLLLDAAAEAGYCVLAAQRAPCFAGRLPALVAALLLQHLVCMQLLQHL